MHGERSRTGSGVKSRFDVASIALSLVAATLLTVAAFASWDAQSDGTYSTSVHLLGVTTCNGYEPCQDLSWGKALAVIGEHPSTALVVAAWAAKFTFGLSLATAFACVVATLMLALRASVRGIAWTLILASTTAAGAITFLVAADAQNLGSAAIGFYLFWLGIVSAIAGALVPRLASAGPARRMCPFCAESIRIEAVVCKHCHQDLDPPPVRKPAAVIVDDDVERAVLDSGVAEVPQTPGRRRLPSAKIGAAALAVLLLGAGGYAIMRTRASREQAGRSAETKARGSARASSRERVRRRAQRPRC